MTQWWTAQPKAAKLAFLLIAFPSALYLLVGEIIEREPGSGDWIAFCLFAVVALFHAAFVLRRLYGGPNG